MKKPLNYIVKYNIETSAGDHPGIDEAYFSKKTAITRYFAILDGSVFPMSGPGSIQALPFWQHIKNGIEDITEKSKQVYYVGGQKTMNNTLLRIENGMSSFELLQAKVASLEAKERRMSEDENRRIAAIDAMREMEKNPTASRRDRLELSVDIPIQCEALKHLHNERCCVSSEIRGLRTAIDLILTVSNYGGEVTPNNRRMIESILA